MSPRNDTPRLPADERTTLDHAPTHLANDSMRLAHERTIIRTAITATLPAIGAMVGKFVEVVLHDLERPDASVVYIVNGHVTGRRVGDSLLDGPKDDKAFLAARKELDLVAPTPHSVIVGYPTVSPQGVLLRSATVVFRDASGAPFLALCMNADVSFPKAALSWFAGFLGDEAGAGGAAAGAVAAPAPAPTVPAARDMPQTADLDGLVDSIIRDAIVRHGKPVREMTREEKLAALEVMAGRGVLMVRGGVAKVAQALSVSRYTIYNYLERLRQREGL
jgi:predicted transcriptional regulator YheO